ncbi:MAG: diguanylate cyclase [Pseudomonadota bacterium]
MPHLPLVSHASYLEDPDGTLVAQDVHARAGDLQWRAATPGNAFNFGHTNSVYWLRVSLRYQGAAPVERLLEVGIPQLDDSRVYLFYGNEQRQAVMLGDRYPFTERPVSDRRLLAPLNFEPGKTADIYVRVASTTSVQVPLALWTRDTLYAQPSAYGAFYGIMLAMVLYNLLLFASVGGSRYLHLALFAASATLFHASLFGQSFRYLWPDSPWWNNVSTIVFGFAGVVFFTMFAKAALKAETVDIRLRNALIVVAWAAAAFALASFAIPVPVSVKLLIATVFVAVPLLLATGILSWRNGVERAGEFTVSWLVFLSGSMVLSLSKMGILPVNTVTSHALEVGLIIQMGMLMYGAVTGSIQVLRDGYRTEREYATHDDLTGLPNRRLFRDRLDHALDKGRSRSLRVGLLFIDLDGFKSVNDTLGHTCGDMLLKGVAERLTTAVRRGDTVARIGGDEFTVILEDINHNLDATLVARKISALFEQPIELETGMKLTIRPSVGVACFPDDGNSAEMLMNQADKAMYVSKNGAEEIAVERARSVL